jgi:hypothetical protein
LKEAELIDEEEFVIGPRSWMILLCRYEGSSDRVYVVAMHDARSAASASAVCP